MKYYGYIYKVTNLVNGKVYVGQHKYDKYPDIDPNYHGSGVLLQQARNKYGAGKFQEEILEWCETKAEANEKELFWTYKLEATVDQGGYVLRAGEDNTSEISQELLERYRSPEWREAISKRMQGNQNGAGAEFTEERRNKISEALKGNQNGKNLKGYKRSEEEKKAMSERAKKMFEDGKMDNFRFAQKGRNIGTKWYTNGEKNIRAKECPEGFVEGITAERKETSKGKKWFNNGVTEIMVKECPEGYNPGRLASVFHRTEEYEA